MPRPARYCLFLALAAAAGYAAARTTNAPPEPPRPVEGQTPTIKEIEARQQEETKRLIGIADDATRPQGERWQAAAGLGLLGTRPALEWLIDHITLDLEPPPPGQGGIDFRAGPKRRVCFWTLTFRHAGWSGDGGNWNTAQIILRAVGKPRTDEELGDYARFLELSLGVFRYSDGGTSSSPRAIAVVDAEIESETVPSRKVGFDDSARATRLKNLRAIRKYLDNLNP